MLLIPGGKCAELRLISNILPLDHRQLCYGKGLKHRHAVYIQALLIFFSCSFPFLLL